MKQTSSSSSSSSIAGVSMALAAAVLWGTTGTAQTFAGSQTSPYWIGALRLAVASVFFVLLITLGRWRVTRRAGLRNPSVSMHVLRTAWPWVLLGGACMAAYNLCFFAGVKAIGVATGTALAIGSGPIWVGLLQSVIARQVPKLVWWLGTALAITGLALMMLGKGVAMHLDITGLMLCLGAGLTYAAYTLTSKHLVDITTPTLATAWLFTAAAVLAVPAAAFASGTLIASATTWGLVAYLGLVATGVSFLLFGHALRHISAATGVTLALGEPVTAFVLAILVVGEQPGAVAYAGLTLVLTGLLLVVWIETRSRY